MASLVEHTASKPKGASSFNAATAQKRYTEHWGGTLDIDVSTMVKGNNVHKTGKPSLISDS